MEFRRVVLMLSSVALASAAPVRQLPLDDRASYEVRISQDAPTTILFPAPITAMDGVNLSAKPEEAPVLLSHQPGTSYFAVRAVQPEASAALNVILKGKAYALAFRSSPTPDRTVTFVEREETMAKPAGTGVVGLLSLLDRAKRYESLIEQYPAVAQQIERVVCPKVESRSNQAEELFRFRAENAVVIRWRLENRTARVLRYAPDELAIQAGDRVWPCTLCDASGSVPAKTAEIVWTVVRGEEVAGFPDGQVLVLVGGPR